MKKYNMLICDDEPYVLDLLKENIDWEQYGVRVGGTAINGQLGLNAFQMEHFDIVLADIKMPLMSGVEMAKQMRKIDDRVQIIFLTSLSEFEYAQSAVNIGACGYILKPFRNKELISAVQTAVARLSGGREQLGAEDESSEQEENADFIVENVNEYIAENIGKKLSVKSIADHFGYSPNYLGHLYHKHAGCYIGDQIIKKCLKFLKTKSDSLRSDWDMGIMLILSSSLRSITERRRKRFVTTVLAGRNSNTKIVKL